MHRGPLADPTVKGQFAGHETFPLRHLWLRKAYDEVVKCGRAARRSVFSDPGAIITLRGRQEHGELDPTLGARLRRDLRAGRHVRARPTR
jgi:Protein of unknown function (DUF4007)